MVIDLMATAFRQEYFTILSSSIDYTNHNQQQPIIVQI